MKSLLISDLHLDASRPAITRQFLDFLVSDAADAAALYILGDLFEVWLGDDDPDPDKRRVVDALARLTAAGTTGYVMHGNRDFLIGERFCHETGFRLLAEGSVVDLHGARVLLTHGDLLCTDDSGYQRLRRRLRHPLSLWAFRHMGLATRRRLAERLRAGSRMHVGSTSPEIMDVNEGAVAQAFRDGGVTLLVHGHTHRPAVHRLGVDGRPVQRIVLGDWYTQGSVLEWRADGFDLRSLPR